MTNDLQQALARAAQLHQSGQLPQAEAIYRQILAQQPNHPQALHLMGVLAHQVGKNDIAADLIRRSIAIDPSQSRPYIDLGTIERLQGNLEESAACFREVLRREPDSLAAHVDLALVLRAQGADPNEIISILRRAISLHPNCAEAHNNLGNVLLDQDRLADAIASFEKAMAINPKLPNAHNNLGNALKERGQIERAIESYRRGLEIWPDQAIYHSNLIYALHFDPDSDCKSLEAEEEKFAQRHESPLAASIRPHTNSRDPDRRLRVGYVSPHFYGHAESFFVAPLLEAHDRTQVEVHCYSSVVKPDLITQRLRKAADVWHDVRAFSDAQLADKIRADEIDILVDLTMHMGNNRLLMFARKPGPVQVAWLAYPSSTGLKSIDYRLSDRFLDPTEPARSSATPGDLKLTSTDEKASRVTGVSPVLGGPRTSETPVTRLEFPSSPIPRYIEAGTFIRDCPGSLPEYRERGQEKPIRLPDCWVCYDPLEEQFGASGAISQPPSARAGHVMFGSLNNPSKHNRHVLALWARVLEAVPGSRLLLLSKDDDQHHTQTIEFFRSHGLSDASRRIEFVATCPRAKYLEHYQRIDIALDPFPYNGITTTCDALWMGVPVVTWPGENPASRAGLGILANVGLGDERVANSEEDYVGLAAKLAGDQDRLGELRQSLRQRMKNSPLMDASRFARNVEQAYRKIWRHWCVSAKS